MTFFLREVLVLCLPLGCSDGPSGLFCSVSIFRGVSGVSEMFVPTAGYQVFPDNLPEDRPFMRGMPSGGDSWSADPCPNLASRFFLKADDDAPSWSLSEWSYYFRKSPPKHTHTHTHLHTWLCEVFFHDCCLCALSFELAYFNQRKTLFFCSFEAKQTPRCQSESFLTSDLILHQWHWS